MAALRIFLISAAIGAVLYCYVRLNRYEYHYDHGEIWIFDRWTTISERGHWRP